MILFKVISPIFISLKHGINITATQAPIVISLKVENVYIPNASNNISIKHNKGTINQQIHFCPHSDKNSSTRQDSVLKPVWERAALPERGDTEVFPQKLYGKGYAEYHSETAG